MTSDDTAGHDVVRAQVHGMWASVAPNWAAQADYLDEWRAVITTAMLDRASVHEGDRVLELACGPGGVGLVAAQKVGPTGEVVVSDVAAEMTAIAERRASDLGLTNVRTAVLDIEHIAQPDETYDVVVCREGLMFAVEPERAAREIHRVLRSSGRIAIAVWGPRARNPWLGELFDAVTEVTGFPVPPPGIPGPFSLEDRDRLRALCAEAGFVDIAVEDVQAPVRAATFESHWDRITTLAGPLAAILGSLPEEVRAAIKDRLRVALRQWETSSGLEIPALTLLASARRE